MAGLTAAVRDFLDRCFARGLRTGEPWDRSDGISDITCQNCRRKTPKSIGWLKTHKQFTCRCGTRVDYFSGSKVKAEIIKLDQVAGGGGGGGRIGIGSLLWLGIRRQAIPWQEARDHRHPLLPLLPLVVSRFPYPAISTGMRCSIDTASTVAGPPHSAA